MLNSDSAYFLFARYEGSSAVFLLEVFQTIESSIVYPTLLFDNSDGVIEKFFSDSNLALEFNGELFNSSIVDFLSSSLTLPDGFKLYFFDLPLEDSANLIASFIESDFIFASIESAIVSSDSLLDVPYSPTSKESDRASDTSTESAISFSSLASSPLSDLESDRASDTSTESISGVTRLDTPLSDYVVNVVSGYLFFNISYISNGDDIIVQNKRFTVGYGSLPSILIKGGTVADFERLLSLLATFDKPQLLVDFLLVNRGTMDDYLKLFESIS